MAEFRSYYGDRSLDVVKGRTYRDNQVYADRTRSRCLSPPPPPLPPPPGSRKATVTVSKTPSSSWSFKDPEMKRKKRVAAYKAYTVEGRVKASFRNGFRWIKNSCNKIVRGY